MKNYPVCEQFKIRFILGFHGLYENSVHFDCLASGTRFSRSSYFHTRI